MIVAPTYFCDMRAFLDEEGHTVDVTALHKAYPAISWTIFDGWAQQLSRNADS
ncbi:hypothetical protein [Streptomyces adustus]|uniref:hypothetical protein n=1 Tax=Streptomyces adustus TaxID=1609272 RepID=UPI00371BC9D7